MKIFMSNKKLRRFIITILSISIFILIDCNFFLTDIAFDYIYSKFLNTHTISINKNTNFLESQNLTMYTLDVEQSECLLFVQNNHVLLIDTGVPEYGLQIADFLESLGITQIDILICTHPHYDHMGGLSTILRKFDIGTMYMTNYDYSKVHKWWAYKYQKIMYFKNIDYITPSTGEFINFANSKIQFITPISSEYTNLNDYSIGVRITYKETDFLCLADAQTMSEIELLNSDFEIQSEIFKVSHHGSTTSNSKYLIQEINPQYAIISVGKNNHYGHPRDFVLQTLKENGTTIYRTDLDGTVAFSTNGQAISVYASNTIKMNN